jgi:hypothetical protein
MEAIASKLQELFQVLNTKEKRLKNLDEAQRISICKWKAFEEILPMASLIAKCAVHY